MQFLDDGHDADAFEPNALMIAMRRSMTLMNVCAVNACNAPWSMTIEIDSNFDWKLVYAVYASMAIVFLQLILHFLKMKILKIMKFFINP